MLPAYSIYFILVLYSKNHSSTTYYQNPSPVRVPSLVSDSIFTTHSQLITEQLQAPTTACRDWTVNDSWMKDNAPILVVRH